MNIKVGVGVNINISVSATEVIVRILIVIRHILLHLNPWKQSALIQMVDQSKSR